MGRPPIHINLTTLQRHDLERLARGRTVSYQPKIRAQIVLACAEGRGTTDVAKLLGVSLQMVSRWRKRFAEGGTEALHDLPRPSATRRLSNETVEELIRTTLQTKPTAQTHWSTRQLAGKLVHNDEPKPFIWTKTADPIIASVARHSQRQFDLYPNDALKIDTSDSGHSIRLYDSW